MQISIKGFFILLTITLALQATGQKLLPVLTVPGKNAYTHIDKNGKTVLPSGRYVTPAGKTIQITHDPFGMAVSPDEKKR
ncbi:MAG: phosphoesterase [Segetibacter sp.]|nr:phosphoesterase [Segetibacter sp.]